MDGTASNELDVKQAMEDFCQLFQAEGQEDADTVITIADLQTQLKAQLQRQSMTANAAADGVYMCLRGGGEVLVISSSSVKWLHVRAHVGRRDEVSC